MENNNSNGISIAALVCGIVGIIGSFFTVVIPAIAIIALIIAIAGIILGAIGMKKANENNGSGNGLAIAGLVCGIVGTVFCFSAVICWACFACAAFNSINYGNEFANELNDIMNDYGSYIQ